jgi:hypothetical protein
MLSDDALTILHRNISPSTSLPTSHPSLSLPTPPLCSPATAGIEAETAVAAGGAQKVRARTAARWWRKTPRACGAQSPGVVCMGGVPTSQRMTVLSSAPVARRRASGEKARVFMARVCPRRIGPGDFVISPGGLCQRRTVSSLYHIYACMYVCICLCVCVCECV